MKVTVKLALALLASHALLASGAPAWAAATKNTNSEKVAKILQTGAGSPAAKAVRRRARQDPRGAGLPEKTPFDQYTIHEFACQANIGAGNYAEAAKECEARLDDQFMPETDKPQLIKTLFALNYQLKNYDKAIDSASAPSRAALPRRKQEPPRAGVLPEGRLEGLPQGGGGAGGYRDQGRPGPEGTAVDPDPKLLWKLEDKACQQHALERMVAYYPKPEHWKNLLFSCSSRPPGTMPIPCRLPPDVGSGRAREPERLQRNGAARARGWLPGRGAEGAGEGLRRQRVPASSAKDRNTRLLETVRRRRPTTRRRCLRSRRRPRPHHRCQERRGRACLLRLRAVRQGRRPDLQGPHQGRPAQRRRSTPAARNRAAQGRPQRRRRQIIQVGQGSEQSHHRTTCEPLGPARAPGLS